MNSGSFWQFIRARQQRQEFILVFLVALAGGLFVGWQYPLPATMADSHNYISAAIEDRFQIYRPFGYSFFLQVVHLLSPRIGMIFFIQHLLYALSLLWFVLSCAWFFGKQNRLLYQLFLAATLITPVYWYMSDSIMSDSLYASLSILWFTSTLWIAKGKRIGFFSLFQAFLLFAMLHTRYIALFYPVLSITLFLWVLKLRAWIPVATTVATLWLFHAQTVNSMTKEARLEQFSTGFAGWQLANNALHIIPHVKPEKQLFTSKRLNFIHEVVSRERDTISSLADGKVTSVFMWDNRLPLKQYMFYLKEERGLPYLIAWIHAGKDLGAYARGLISHYPVEYIRYYLLPNTWNALWVQPGMVGRFEDHPKLEILNKWFAPTIEKGSYRAKGDFFERFAGWLRPLSLAGWVLLATLLVRKWFFRSRRPLTPEVPQAWFWFSLAFTMAYVAAVIWASPIEVRYFLPLIPVKALLLYLLLLPGASEAAKAPKTKKVS